MRGAPEGIDVLAQILEVVDDIEGVACIFMVGWVESESVCSGLVVDTDEYWGT